MAQDQVRQAGQSRVVAMIQLQLGDSTVETASVRDKHSFVKREGAVVVSIME
jgi:hypothetical protein